MQNYYSQGHFSFTLQIYLIVSLLIGTAFTAPAPQFEADAQIINQDTNIEPDGSYSYR